MAGQNCTLSAGPNNDGAYATFLDPFETDRNTASLGDSLFDGSGGAGIVLPGGLAQISAPAHVGAAPAFAGSNSATGLYGSDPVYTGTYLNGIVLSNPATQNPATVAATGYVTNHTGPHNGDAIYGAPVYPWTVANLGTLNGPGYAAGLHLTAGGVLTNGQSGSSAALIEGNYGVLIGGGVGTVSNFGKIFGGEGYFFGAGVELAAGGSVTNGQSGSPAGLIAGGGSNNYAGVAILGGVGTVTNFGTIQGRTSAVILGAGGNVANFGTIDGPFSGSGIMLGALASTVTNAGTIIGSSGTAVQFGGGDDLLVVDPGAVFVGKVDGGGGHNTLELAAGAGPGLLSGLGTSFVNFGTVTFDTGAVWTVTLDNPAAFTGTISGFSSGDILDLTGAVATGVNYSGGVLALLNGSTTVATINLAGSYTSSDFSLNADGNGGTDVTVSNGSSPGIAVFDTTTGSAIAADPVPYTGPVSGLQEQYIYTGNDSLDVSVSTHNWFIHTGGGNDAIAVAGGINVLDGGIGSNFLTGGSGTDTFFIDDRSPPADIWSTVNGFHRGDAATVFGITPNAFNTNWFDGQGAPGYTGLTLHATAPSHPTASLTLVGYSSADLQNGRLSVSFGAEQDGTPYMFVFANS